MQLPSDQDASGRSLGAEEIELLTAAITSGTLTSTKGRFVTQFEKDFAEAIGAKHAFACASGSAAVHLAIAAIDPEPGEEIITTPITDMGAITPILYQGAIPVFADVDPDSCNVTAETIERCISERTRAIVVTHLFGNPADMGPILKLAQARGIPLIEDCAQAFHARICDQQVGTFGRVGCFSLQQGKHITTGEGGVVTTDDDEIARRLFLLINKAWGYGDPKPDHYFLALNYRMSELQGAVALAQLGKLADNVAHRRNVAARISDSLANLQGLTLPSPPPGGLHSYWKYAVMVDPLVIEGGPVGLGNGLKEYAIASAPRYIQKPAFECAVIREQRTFGQSRWPFTLARPDAVDYSHDRFPGAYSALERILVLPINEKYTNEHVDYVCDAIKAQHAQLYKERKIA
jgi:perosamine synthetase